MKLKNQLTGLSPYKPGKPMEEVKAAYGLDQVFKLASNENPFGASPLVQEAVQAAAAKPALYPDGYAQAVRTELAESLGVEEKQLLFGAGSDEVILMLCRAYLDAGTNTVMAVPTFSQYKHNAIVEGAEIREVPLVEGDHDLESMLEAIDENTRIVWVCNPNNPSGGYINAEAFASFLARVPSDVLVVSDEAYIEYVEAEDYPDTLQLLRTYDNLVLLRTFSKAYGLAALRFGFGIGPAKLMQEVDPIRPPFNTTALAQEAARAAWRDQAFIHDCKEKTLKNKHELMNFAKENGLSYYPSEANFLLLDTGFDGDEVFQALLERGVIVRSGQALGFPTCIRVTIGTDEEMEHFQSALKAFLHEKAESSAQR
ncbi:histidinol-phosphate aminotransferase [Salsuginibacillus halophilus]|uniref:Histidinol-phosphate aminotransferase n=1 Tax=Salsuginibacillus halophilus TaxID=517424 RepID=A0A2P8HWF0_9BACI|nr:histidinol-phosphate transaminase [Salsuginibacillus halophilus]PSL50504.1 histidinol-phosphate aminotransferase [Salsuginibacillus halophilus]